MKRKLKLTKLTIADLDRAKGGVGFCGCLYTNPQQAAYNYDVVHTISVCAPLCWIDVN